MRHVPLGFCVGAVLLLAGCNNFPVTRAGGVPPQVSQVPAETPSKEQLIAYLNENAGRIQSVRCMELDLDARQGLQSVGLRGMMACQKPRNFRMGAKVIGKDAVDMGSNDQEFWYWISEAKPAYLFHCSYADLSRGNVGMPFPFQPEWVMEALGIKECSSPENYELKVTPTTLELVEQSRSPQGLPVRKVVVFNRAPAHGVQPQVTAHLLQDAGGKEICAAYVSEVQIDRATGAVLPHKVRLNWPSEKIELKMKLDEVTFNDPSIVKGAERLFARPNLNNVPAYDLASRTIDGQIRRAGAFLRAGSQ